MTWQRRALALGTVVCLSIVAVVSLDVNSGAPTDDAGERDTFVVLRQEPVVPPPVASPILEEEPLLAEAEESAPLIMNGNPSWKAPPMEGVPTAIDFDDIDPEHLAKMREDPLWVVGRAEEAQEAFLSASSPQEREEQRKEYLYFMHLAASGDVPRVRTSDGEQR